MGDDKRKVIEKLVRKVLDHRDEKVVSVVQKCLDRGYDYRKMKDRLDDEIRDGAKSAKLAESVLEEFPTSKKRPKFEEAKNGKEEANGGEAKKPKIEQDLKVNIEQDLKVKELMSQAQRTIEERKKQLKLPTTPATSGLSRTMLNSSKLAPEEAKKFMALTVEKQLRATELRAKIANRFPSAIVNLQPSAMAALAAVKPVPLLLDNTGRQIDPYGNELLLPKQTPTLKANIRAEKRELFRRAQLEIEQPAKAAPTADDADAPAYLDPRVSQRGAMRQRRQFKFHDKGEFEQLANKQRAKAKLEKLQAEISQAAKNTGISSAVKLAMVAPTDTSDREVPLMEWWDSVVLDGKDYDCLPSVSDDKVGTVDYSQTISNLVEHPIQLKPPDEPMQPHYLKVFLTKKERKKIRRQNRKEAQKEKTEKIRLGLEPPPEPKMKISNLMRVLGSEAVQDPTKMEAHVRKQMAERQRKHETANTERQLTDEQRSAKKIKKMHEDVSLGVHVAVYRLKSLAHPAKKFKVEMNAKQLQMTGVIVVHKDINIVIVEGGPKQQKFFKRLLLGRIKWEDEIIGQKKDADKNAEGERNKCDLVWEGLVKKRNFGEVRCKAVTLEKQARELLDKHGVAHYWDMAYSGAVLLHDGGDDNIV